MKNKFYSFLGIVNKAGKLNIGYNKSEEAILGGYAKLLIISEELSSNSKKKFEHYCEKYNVPLIKGASCLELSSVISKGSTKVVSINDKGMSEKLLTLWDENNKNDI